MTEKLYEVKQTIVSSSTGSIVKILEFWPSILGAIGVFLFGWTLSILVKKVIEKIANKFRFLHFAKKTGFENLLKKANITSPPGEVIAKFLQAWIVTIFLLSATKILHLDAVSGFLEKIINFIPNVIVALLIVLFAVKMGEFIGGIVAGAFLIANSNATKIVSLAVKNILIAFGVMAALVELNIAKELIQIIFTGFIAMLALAGGLSFGLGGKEAVKTLLKDLKKKKK